VVDADYASRAHSAVTLPSGEVPYILDGANCSSAHCSGITPSVGGPWPYDTMSYATEGVAAVALRFPQRRDQMIQQWKPAVDFLLRTQNSDGFWGRLGSSDLMRSPRCLTLLSWWLNAVESAKYKDVPTRNAVAKSVPLSSPCLPFPSCHESLSLGPLGRLPYPDDFRLHRYHTRSIHDECLPSPVSVACWPRYLNYLVASGSGPYGVLSNTITTGMAGLAAADAVSFGATYSSSFFNPPAKL
jgi:hypothetical protein